MTNKVMPDGYCAWHPEKGYLDYREGTTAYETYCVMPNRAFCADSAHVRTGSQFVKDKNSKGWQIKPVALLDPARLKRLEAIEEWAKGVVQDLQDKNIADIADLEKWEVLQVEKYDTITSTHDSEGKEEEEG